MREYLQKQKYHFIVFFVLLIVAGVSGYLTFATHDTRSTTQTKSSTPRLPKPEAHADGGQATYQSPTPLDNGYHVPSLASLNQQPKASNPQQVVTLRVAENEYAHSLASTTTVYQLMLALSAKQGQTFTFSGRDYASLGFFVEEINGVKNDRQAGRYWIYYINGESAQVGVSSYVLKPNDLIEWKYENTNYAN